MSKAAFVATTTRRALLAGFATALVLSPAGAYSATPTLSPRFAALKIEFDEASEAEASLGDDAGTEWE